MNNYPKIELHCHLDGSMRADSIIDMAMASNISLPTTNINELKPYLVAPENCTSLKEYLNRFDIPLLVLQTEENLERAAYELFEDCHKDNIKYLEVRFGPQLHRRSGLTLDAIISSVIKGMNRAKAKYPIEGNIILSCLRHHSVERADEVIEVGRKYLGKGVCAVDLAGAEPEGFADPFIEVFNKAKEYGYHITIHAGETGFGSNVVDAISKLHAERIGHGVFIENHPESYNLVKENHVTLEMCPTSNMQTKAINDYKDHPIYKFMTDGIRVSLNTDNMTVSDVLLSSEFETIEGTFNLSSSFYKEVYKMSVDAAFTTEEIKNKLLTYL